MDRPFNVGTVLHGPRAHVQWEGLSANIHVARMPAIEISSLTLLSWIEGCVMWRFCQRTRDDVKSRWHIFLEKEYGSQADCFPAKKCLIKMSYVGFWVAVTSPHNKTSHGPIYLGLPIDNISFQQIYEVCWSFTETLTPLLEKVKFHITTWEMELRRWSYWFWLEFAKWLLFVVLTISEKLKDCSFEFLRALGWGQSMNFGARAHHVMPWWREMFLPRARVILLVSFTAGGHLGRGGGVGLYP